MLVGMRTGKDAESVTLLLSLRAGLFRVDFVFLSL